MLEKLEGFVKICKLNLPTFLVAQYEFNQLCICIFNRLILYNFIALIFTHYFYSKNSTFIFPHSQITKISVLICLFDQALGVNKLLAYCLNSIEFWLNRFLGCACLHYSLRLKFQFHLTLLRLLLNFKKK